MKYTKLSILLASMLTTSVYSQTLELDTIYVTTATKTAQSVKDLTANVEVITSDDLEDRKFTTVFEALSSVAGINFTSAGGLGQSADIYLRGLESKRLLLLIDGIRYNDPTSLSGAPFEHLMINDIERIEIVKGAQSGVWGADASAGVINIITKSAKEGSHITFNSEFGSYSTEKFAFQFSHKNELFDIKLNADKLKSDGFSTMLPENGNLNDFERDGYNNKTASAKVGINFTQNDRVEAYYKIIDAASEYDGGDFGASIEEKANSDEYSSDAKYQFYSLAYFHNSERYSVKLFANKTKFERDYSKGWSTEFDGENSELGIQTNIPYANNSYVMIGADQKKFKNKNEINKEYKGTGYYIANSNKFSGFTGGSTVLSESIRFDDYDAFKNKVTYKIGLKHFHKNIDGFTGSFNYATSYNVPSLYQLYSMFGNSELEPENIKGFDVTLDYKNFSVTYFDNTLEDMIDYDFTINKYNNVEGESRFKGVEAKIVHMFESIDTRASLNYTHIIAEDFEGYQLPRRAKDSFNIALDYYGIDNFHAGLLGQYVGKRIEYDYGTHNISANTGKYMVWDFVADIYMSKNMSIYVKANNIFDKKYQTVRNYAAEQRSVYMGVKLNY